AIHPFESLMHDRTLRFTVVRELLVTTLKDWTRILNRASDCRKQLQFHPPVPHLDLRLFAQVVPEQVWLGMKPLQIAADRDRLGRHDPSSNSSTGTPPDGFFARNSGVRL